MAMGRPKRAGEAGAIYHMLNRANRRATIFHKAADYEAFERIIAEALDQARLKLFSFCLMPTHWHLVVSPDVDGEMSRFAQWLGLTHTQFGIDAAATRATQEASQLAKKVPGSFFAPKSC